MKFHYWTYIDWYISCNSTFLHILLFFCENVLILNLGKSWFFFRSDYHQQIPIATTTTLASTTSTETQEYVDEIYDEDYYMAPSIIDPYVPPRECNKIEWWKNVEWKI